MFHFPKIIKNQPFLRPQIISISYPITGPDRSLGFKEVEAARIYRQSEHEGGKDVSPSHRRSLKRLETLLVLICVREWVVPQDHMAAGRIKLIKTNTLHYVYIYIYNAVVSHWDKVSFY